MKEIKKDIWIQATSFPLNKALEFLCVLPITENWTGKKILDFGCGAGRDSVFLAKSGADVYGVDIIQTNLDYAKKLCKVNKVKAKFKLIKEKDDIPYPTNFFDGIICNGVLHHIKHVEEIVDEFRRVLKPGGMVYVMLYTEDLFRLDLNNIINVIKNNPEKTWQRCFGEMTDKCNYTTFYSIYEAQVLFVPRSFTYLVSIPYHDFQFRIFKFRNDKI